MNSQDLHIKAISIADEAFIKKFSGQLEAADEQGIHVNVDGRPYDIPYSNIDKARLIPEF